MRLICSSACAAEEDSPGLLFTRLAGNLQETFPDAKLPKLLVRSLVHRLFFSINWLHATCNTIHTVISPQNVLSGLEDDAPLKAIQEQEAQDPSIPITSDEEQLLYSSPDLPNRSLAMRESQEGGNQEWCIPDIYQAPEVLLKLPFGFPVDMWSIGVMTLELIKGKNLFDPLERVHNQYSFH
ncbi:hypothetical protein AJ79_04946 [Helicocarpus griseus UAMH5409]|uniref:non-specific serine/threonine protein kinase n=1 Tax=Helicocarpus griseus UAMH5409 TaxID=1447875 RepID=A0A2B7XQT0_9EURO|nr:hypothetical protein AJ79_04946 [Helicocarpus griseus UAMH5409]